MIGAIDLGWPALAGIAGAVALGYTVFGLVGFGAGIVALPLLVHTLPVRLAVPVMLVLDLTFAALLGVRNRALIERGELLRLVPFLLVGMALGVVTLARADERVLLMLLGGFVFAYALWSLAGRVREAPVSRWWVVPTGLVGGVFSALFGTGGPIYTLYLATRIADTARLRASIGTLIFGSAFVRAFLLAGGGFFAPEGLLWLALALVPCAGLGYWLGSRVHARLPQARVRRVIWALLVASGASLIWRGLATG